MANTRAWANDPEVARLMNRARPVSESEHEAWFEAVLTRTDCVFFAIEEAAGSSPGHHVGNVWLWNVDQRHHKAELRIVIGEAAARERRLGTQAIDLICGFAFARMNLHRIYAHVLATNPRARHAFEHAGFVLEGTLRDDRWADDGFVDVYLLGRLAPAE